MKKIVFDKSIQFLAVLQVCILLSSSKSVWYCTCIKRFETIKQQEDLKQQEEWRGTG